MLGVISFPAPVFGKERYWNSDWLCNQVWRGGALPASGVLLQAACAYINCQINYIKHAGAILLQEQ